MTNNYFILQVSKDEVAAGDLVLGEGVEAEAGDGDRRFKLNSFVILKTCSEVTHQNKMFYKTLSKTLFLTFGFLA